MGCQREQLSTPINLYSFFHSACTSPLNRVMWLASLGETKHLTFIDLFAGGNKSDEKERGSMGKRGNYNLKGSRGFFVNEGSLELLTSVIIAKTFHWLCLYKFFGKKFSDLRLNS